MCLFLAVSEPTTVSAVSQLACTCRGELLFFDLNFLFKTTLKSLQYLSFEKSLCFASIVAAIVVVVLFLNPFFFFFAFCFFHFESVEEFVCTKASTFEFWRQAKTERQTDGNADDRDEQQHL